MGPIARMKATATTDLLSAISYSRWLRLTQELACRVPCPRLCVGILRQRTFARQMPIRADAILSFTCPRKAVDMAPGFMPHRQHDRRAGGFIPLPSTSASAIEQ